MVIGKGSYNEVAVLSGDGSRWIPIQLKPRIESRGGGVVCLYDEIYVFGGIYQPERLQKLEKNMKWTRLADMNHGRTAITNSCLTWNGFIWVFGGRDSGRETLKSVERYDPKTDRWTRMP